MTFRAVPPSVCEPLKRPHAVTDLLSLANRIGAMPAKFRAGATLFRPGDPARGWIVLQAGRIRVGLIADNGREILLYRVATGEACLLSTSALLSSEPLAAFGVAETDIDSLVVPAARFERLLAEDAEFRVQVLRGYAQRVADLVTTIEDAMFHALPERLARLLIARASGGVVEATHQEIAAELGSAREVVSRVLRRFERDGLIAGERGRLRLLDPDRLSAMGG